MDFERVVQYGISEHNSTWVDASMGKCFLCAMTVRPAVEADIGGSAFHPQEPPKHLRYHNDNLQQQQSDLLVPD